MLESLRKYYVILKQDLTREGIVSRKLFLESITGSDVCDKNLLSQVSHYMDARKPSVLEGSKLRSKIESDQKLIPIMNRLERKAPEGGTFISIEWKLKAVSFYETDEVSDVCKGHHCVFKVCKIFKLDYLIDYPISF